MNYDDYLATQPEEKVETDDVQVDNHSDLASKVTDNLTDRNKIVSAVKDLQNKGLVKPRIALTDASITDKGSGLYLDLSRFEVGSKTLEGQPFFIVWNSDDEVEHVCEQIAASCLKFLHSEFFCKGENVRLARWLRQCMTTLLCSIFKVPTESLNAALDDEQSFKDWLTERGVAITSIFSEPQDSVVDSSDDENPVPMGPGNSEGGGMEVIL